MSATFDLERELALVLQADGPTQPPAELVDGALARARQVGQRRPILQSFDRRSWPPATVSFGNPAVARAALVALVALLVVGLLAGLVAVGGPLLRQLLPAPPAWELTGAMASPRDDSSAVVLLADGKVLALGGGPSTGRYRSAEIYDPALGTWTYVGDMLSPRGYGAATTLRDGRVLVSGGTLGRQAEVFDPATRSWSATADMVEARSQHVTILLPSGEVLAAGGTPGDDPTLAAEIYDPTAGTWRPAGIMTVWRASPTATLLRDGRVLVVQGYGAGIQLRAVEIYDPATDTWAPTGFASEFRDQNQTVTLLRDGRVLVTGGAASVAEIWDPADGTFTTVAPPLANQGNGTAALLDDGTVLLAGGGADVIAPSRFAETYDPASGAWTATAPLHQARMGAHTVVLLDGSVLVVGGQDAAGPLASVERYHPGD